MATDWEAKLASRIADCESADECTYAALSVLREFQEEIIATVKICLDASLLGRKYGPINEPKRGDLIRAGHEAEIKLLNSLLNKLQSMLPPAKEDSDG